MSVSVRSRTKSLSFLSAIALLVGVLVPLMGTPALASHDTRTLEVTPETANAAAGTTHILTATLSAAAVTPIEVDFEVESGPTITKVSSTPDGTSDVPGTGNDGNTPMSPDLGCVVAAAGTTCTVSFRSVAQGTNLVRSWIDHDGLDATDPTAAGPAGDEMRADEPRDETPAGPDPLWLALEEPNTTDAVEVTWTPATVEQHVLDCEPETGSKPVLTAHNITCTVETADDSSPAAGQQVDVEISGANDPDGSATNQTPDLSCTTVANGTCTVTHPTAAATANGTSTYRAWVDADGNNATVEASLTEPRDETGAPWVLTGDEPNSTDVVENTWTGGPDTLVMTPPTNTSLVGNCVPYTIVLSTGATPKAGATIDVEQVHASSGGTAGDEPDVRFCTPTSGPNPSAVNEGGGDLVEAPDDPATAGGETALTTNASGQITIGVSVVAGGSSDGSGDVVITAFFDANNDDDPTAGEPSDTSTQTWEPGGPRTIDCLPVAGTSETSEDHEVTCTVEDRNGDPLEDVDVVFEETGAGDFAAPADAEGTTDSSGVVKTHLSSSEAGEQQVTATIAADTGAGEPGHVDECDRVAGDPTGAPAGQCQDTVSVTWVQAPAIDERCDDPGVICGTDGDDVLVGTAGDDVIICGDGDDVVEAMGGNDRIECGGGNDEVDGGGGNDKIFGAGGNDVLKGAGGRDAISGGAGKDRLVGSKGNDTLRGKSGNDTIKGGGGNDVLNGGPGKDTCTPGKGKDKVRRCEK